MGLALWLPNHTNTASGPLLIKPAQVPSKGVCQYGDGASHHVKRPRDLNPNTPTKLEVGSCEQDMVIRHHRKMSRGG